MKVIHFITNRMVIPYVSAEMHYYEHDDTEISILPPARILNGVTPANAPAKI